MALLEVENLSFTYPDCRAPALKDISFSMERGDFITLMGATGSGKSTLLRLLKRELQPLGGLHGSIRCLGQDLSALDPRLSASAVGYVCQRPEQQLVCDKVWHELAFGPENLGMDSDTIRRRVSEMASYFGIEDWFDRNVCDLSGGQKQLLNLAAVMVMQPDILLLDEPTAQLDPIAASDFISAIRRLNRDLSLTVLIIEHRLEEVIPISDKLLVLENGAVRMFGETRTCVSSLLSDPDMLECLPASVRLFARFPVQEPCPLTVREGRSFVNAHFSNDIHSLPLAEDLPSAPPVLSFEDVCFRYGRMLPDVLRHLTFTVRQGEIFCVLGGNGSGKSTMLSAAAALVRPYAGKIRILGRDIRTCRDGSLFALGLAFLPQDVQTVFLCNTVREELKGVDLSALPFDLSPLLDRHPYDLSGGQQQLAALAKVLASKPRILLLDEPTKGLDAHTRGIFVQVLKTLQAQGMTVVCVTHDVEFAALLGGRCALFFRGEITSCGMPRPFFSGNSFYTTAVSRIMHGAYELTATVEDAVDLLKANGGLLP